MWRSHSSKNRTYIAIDLKSFYASVECVDRGLDPLTTRLVVADKSRTEKTICLAVSPAMKAFGIGGRARLFEVVQRVKELKREHPDWNLDYIIAPPRMAHYIEVSRAVYQVYLKYIAPEDIHVYSIDEVFMDVTPYLNTYKKTPHELAITIIRDVLQTTGITATAGIGTNLYLAKVAMDIVAKHIPADKDGVRIGELDEMTYRQQLWNHRPLTSFWRIGRGIAAKLARYGADTMGKLARLSLTNERLLYRLFGVNAELLIDHAWGWEPCTLEAIKAYRPENNSFSSGQVLQKPYDWKKARVVVREMADTCALHLVARQMVTDQVVLTVNYDVESLTNPHIRAKYKGPVTLDYYGRTVPKHAHGTAKLGSHTSSTKLIVEAILTLYDRIVNPELLIRRINITTQHVIRDQKNPVDAPQLDLFKLAENQKHRNSAAKERRIQEAQLAIKERFGRNAILKGTSFEEGATARERNAQIGGHKA